MVAFKRIFYRAFVAILILIGVNLLCVAGVLVKILVERSIAEEPVWFEEPVLEGFTAQTPLSEFEAMLVKNRAIFEGDLFSKIGKPGALNVEVVEELKEKSIEMTDALMRLNSRSEEPWFWIVPASQFGKDADYSSLDSFVKLVRMTHAVVEIGGVGGGGRGDLSIRFLAKFHLSHSNLNSAGGGILHFMTARSLSINRLRTAEGILNLSKRGEVSVDSLVKLRESVRDSELSAESLRFLVLNEMSVPRAGIGQLATGVDEFSKVPSAWSKNPVLNWVSFDRNETLGLFHEGMLPLVETSGKSWPEFRFAIVRSRQFRKEKQLVKRTAFLKGNHRGRELVEESLAGYETILLSHYSHLGMCRAFECLIAIRTYEEINGELPTSLDELVPSILSSVPEDPYTGKPIHYDREKEVVYSVGVNEADDGGSVRDGALRETVSDIGFKLVRPYRSDEPDSHQ